MDKSDAFRRYAETMITFLIDFRGIALEDLEPEIVADAMIRGADNLPGVWRERERCWNDSYQGAVQALKDLKRQ